LNLKKDNYLIRDDELNRKIEEFVKNELDYGFLLLIPKEKVSIIARAKACPIHVTKQTIINDEGNKVIKCRLYYNLLFSLWGLKNLSINN